MTNDTKGPKQGAVESASPDYAAETRDALLRNVSAQMLAKVGYLVTRFLIPPFVLAHIGLEAYGVWATAFVLVGYLGISTFGISNVYIKYVAEYSAKREYERANGVLSAGVLITSAFSLLLFGAVYLLLPDLLIWLEVSPALRIQAGDAVLTVVAVFLASIALSVFGDTLIGRQRIAAKQTIWVISYLVETLLIFVLVGWGRGIQGLAEAFLIRMLIEIGLAWFVVMRSESWFSLSPANITRQSLRVILHFGGAVQLVGFMAILLNSIERLLAATLIGVRSAGLVDIAKKLPGMGASIPSTFATAFIPAASYLQGGLGDGADGQAKLSQLYLKGGRYMNLTAAFVCAFLATLPQPILDVWLGERYSGMALIMMLFAIAVQINQLTGPGTSIFNGIGWPYEAFYYTISNMALLLVLVPLSRLLAGGWELLPMVIAIVISRALSAWMFIRRANRLFHIATRDYLVRVIFPGLLPYLVGILIAIPVGMLQSGLDRMALAMLVMVAGVVYSMLTMGCVLFMILDPGERGWFKAMAAPYMNRLRPHRLHPKQDLR